MRVAIDWGGAHHLAGLARGSLLVLAGESSEQPARLALLVNIEGDAVTLIRAGESVAASIPQSELTASFAGVAIQAAPAA